MVNKGKQNTYLLICWWCVKRHTCIRVFTYLIIGHFTVAYQAGLRELNAA